MKAKEYFAKHDLSEPLDSGKNKTIAVNNVRDMILEMRNTAHERNVKTDNGFKSILMETIDKFRAYNDMIEKHYGERMLKEDCILIYIQGNMPDIYDDVKSLLG